MNKIGTHDSATGESGKGFLSWIITPFSKTQCKTIKEQYEAGCRMFDMRIKHKYGDWRCAHGLWVSERSAEDIIKELNEFPETCYVAITYEGGYDSVKDFSSFVDHLIEKYSNIFWGGIGIKYGEGSSLFKVKFDYLKPYPTGWPPSKQGFLPLDGRSWHIILPIPWLWKKIYYNTPEFNEDYYLYVDFL